MTVCPFCKAPTSASHGPCPQCGRLAGDHPSIAAVQGRTLSTDWEDDDAEGLSLEKGAGVGSGTQASYEGGGVSFDDDLFGDSDQAALELDAPHAARPKAPPPPAPPPAPVARPSGTMSAVNEVVRSAKPPPPPEEAAPGPAPAPEPPPPPPPPSAAALVAKYPPPPQTVLQAPGYAMRVLLRQLELRQDLESLRRKRSKDVPLYEAALHAHDKKAFNLGMALSCAALLIACIIFFLPVILRFVRAPD